MAIEQTSPDDPTQPKPLTYEDYQRDYWAPDREQVLASMQSPSSPDSAQVPSTTSPVSASGPTSGNTGINGTPTGTVQPATSPTAAPWTQTATPGGFDATKWNDPTKSDPKYDIGHMVASGMTNDQISQYVASHFPGWSIVGTDTIRDPQGNIFDFRRDQEGANAPFWELANGGGSASGAPGVAGTSGMIGSTLGGQQGASTAPSSSAFNDQVRQLLMQQLGGLTGPVNAQDPQIKAVMDAQTATLDRQRMQQRAADAERQAMNGLLNGGQSSGAFEQNIASGFENENQQLTGLQAQLFAREIDARRQQVTQLLNMALSSGDAESARQLQAYLAQLDNAYRYAALNQNQSQFNDDFGLRAGEFQYRKDSDLARYGAGY